MLFVAIGLITLFVSFLIAVVMLIRELGQRPNIDEATFDYSSELADEEISAESNLSDSPVMGQKASMNPLPQDAFPDTASLDEVVPFPWVMEDNTQSSQEELGKPQETEIASNESIQGQNPVNLNSSFSVSDLVNKD